MVAANPPGIVKKGAPHFGKARGAEGGVGASESAGPVLRPPY